MARKRRTSTRRTVRFLLRNNVEAALAEERRQADERAHAARSRARIVQACWLDDEHDLVAITVERGHHEPNLYTVRRRSPTARRLAFLFGANGQPLFQPRGVNLPKRERAQPEPEAQP